MTLYALALFTHVVGALLLFVTLALDGLGLLGLRQATTLTQVGEWAKAARLARVTGPVSALAILVPGLYMAASAWGFDGWILAGAAGWLLVAGLAAFSGIRLARALRATVAQGALLPGLQARLRDPVLVSSWLARAALSVGAVFTMTVKPPAAMAALAIAVAAAAGLAASRPAWRRHPCSHEHQARTPVHQPQL